MTPVLVHHVPVSTHRRDPRSIPWTARPRRRLDWSHDWRVYVLVLTGMPALMIGGTEQLLTGSSIGQRLGGLLALALGGLVLVSAFLYVRRPTGVGE